MSPCCYISAYAIYICHRLPPVALFMLHPVHFVRRTCLEAVMELWAIFCVKSTIKALEGYEKFDVCSSC